MMKKEGRTVFLGERGDEGVVGEKSDVGDLDWNEGDGDQVKLRKEARAR